MKKTIMIIVSAAAVAYSAIAGGVLQKPKAAETNARPVEYTAQTYSTKEAKVGDYVVCPVMGTKFQVKEKSLSVTVKDKKYYVCCGMCTPDLKKNPDKYLKDDVKKADTNDTREKKHDHSQHHMDM